MLLRVVVALLFTSLSGLFAAESTVGPPLKPQVRQKMLDGFAAEILALNEKIAETPTDPRLYSRRGDMRLFRAEFPAAIADFEKMIALDATLDAPHWRLGIAYYFNGQFAKSATQFEKYHSYDGRDRENGIWKYLADARGIGIEAARAAMLPYSRFDREPFPTLYAVFAGTKTVEALYADLKTRGLDENAQVKFFADYYAGLSEELSGRREIALQRLHAAVANSWAQSAEGGPAYMWQVARLDYERLAARHP